MRDVPATAPVEEAPKPETDPFEEIDFGSFFDDYLDPGFKSPAAESVEKPSFETFLSSPVTLSDHLQASLRCWCCRRQARGGKRIIGNLEESGYLTTPLEEIADSGGLTLDDVQAGSEGVQSLDPTGVGAPACRNACCCSLMRAGHATGWRGRSCTII